jgi:hypothetical protein
MQLRSLRLPRELQSQTSNGDGSICVMLTSRFNHIVSDRVVVRSS